MKERILIFGNGQLGNFYNSYFSSKNIESQITTADITNFDEVKTNISNYSPTVVINTAAKTNLEWCALNKLETFNVNVLGADNIAQACDQQEIYFIHLSSGCIFESKDENDAKSEDDIPMPAAYYSSTKVWSEQLIKFKKSPNFKYLILRPRQPVSSDVNYKNMLIKMLTFTKFIDTPNSGTVIEDLMDWTEKLIEKRYIGTVHVSNEGWSTPYEIGLMLKKHVLPSLEVTKITKKELDKTTPNRRVDTILNVNKLKSLGLEVKPYKEQLEYTIQKLGQNIKTMDKVKLKEEFDKTLEQTKARTTPNTCWSDLLK